MKNCGLLRFWIRVIRLFFPSVVTFYSQQKFRAAVAFPELQVWIRMVLYQQFGSVILKSLAVFFPLVSLPTRTAL